MGYQKESNMQTIEFNRTSNVFLNTGIIALEYYLDRYKEEQSLSDDDLNFELQDHKLIVNSLKLLEILEEVYYLMGREVYDTSGKKAREKVDKYYFIKTPFKAEPFAKMKTYGFAELLTNDAQPTPSKKGSNKKFHELYNSDIDFANNVALFLAAKGIKLKHASIIEGAPILNQVKSIDNKGKPKYIENSGGESNIFIDAIYTKVPDLDFDISFFEAGNIVCYLTGIKRKKLLEIKNSSPFANLSSFSSFREKTKDKQISWEATYLIRFAPKFIFYSYLSGLDYIVCYSLNTNNLLNLKKYFRLYASFFKTELELIENNYLSNFTLYNFKNQQKDTDNERNTQDFTEQFEVLFMLIYTIYQKLLFNQNASKSIDDLLSFLESDEGDIELVSIMGDRNLVGNTLRITSFEIFNQFKFIVRLIGELEKYGIVLSSILRSLKFLKSADKNVENKYRLERQLRNKVLGKVLKQKSVVSEIETLFYDCFMYLNSNENIGYKDYKMLVKFLEIYEPIINQNMDKEQFQTLQNRAINLGKSIGMSILTFDEGNKQANAKDARTYIIGLHKARTAEQFREAIIRIQTKYGLVMSGELLQGLNEETFEFIKQYAVISALNIINSVIKPQNDSKNEN